MDLVEVIRKCSGTQKMIAILTVGEVVVRQVCSGHDYLVINTVKLHVLQAPAFVDSFRDDLLPKTGEIRGVKHTNFNPVPKFGYQGGK